MRTTTLTPLPLLLTLLLAACGGGGGGDDGGTSTTSETEVALTAENMEQAGSTSVAAADVGSVPPANVGDFVTGAQATTAGPASGTIQTLLGRQLLAFVTITAGDTVNGITLTQTRACSVSGNVALTIEDSNGQIDAGDALTARFNACDNGEGVIDGDLSLALSSLSGDFSPTGSVSGNASFTALRVATTNGTVTTSGDMNISLQQDATGVAAEYRSTNVRYELAGTVRQGTLTVASGIVIVSEDATGTTTSIAQTITAAFPRFTGTLVLTTTNPIVTASNGEIQSGTLDVTGASGSVTLTFQGGDQVLLELDANDDTTPEVTRTLSLSALELTAF